MYFIEMFADPSDRARFLAILLSAFFVGLGVWYTQRQITNRENKAFKVSKIEELYKTTNEYIHLIENIEKIQAENSTNRAQFIVGMGVEKKGLVLSEVKNDLLKSHKHLEMLINLYFPSHVYINKFKSVDELANGDTIRQALKNIQTARGSTSINDLSIDVLTEEAEYYINLTKELSRMRDTMR
jgi:hypothetical protein